MTETICIVTTTVPNLPECLKAVENVATVQWADTTGATLEQGQLRLFFRYVGTDLAEYLPDELESIRTILDSEELYALDIDYRSIEFLKEVLQVLLPTLGPSVVDTNFLWAGTSELLCEKLAAEPDWNWQVDIPKDEVETPVRFLS